MRMIAYFEQAARVFAETMTGKISDELWHKVWSTRMKPGQPTGTQRVELALRKIAGDVPIPMVLPCPRCGTIHVDAPNPSVGWDNPPHRSHQCQTCDTIWRPADVCTVGVAAVETVGKEDNWPDHAG